MYITRLPVRRSRPPTRRSNQSHALSSTTATSKTEKASSESIRARASTTVECRNRLERTGRRRVQGRRPPPDARTGTRAFNASVAFSPNTPVTGSMIGNKHPSCHSFLQPSPPNNTERVRTQEAGSEHLIKTPSRHPRSMLWLARRYTASDPQPDMIPSWGRVGRPKTALQPLRRISRRDVQACGRQTSPRRRTEQDTGARAIIIKLPGQDGLRPHWYGGLE